MACAAARAGPCTSPTCRRACSAPTASSEPAAKTLKTGGVAVAFYGDGASNQGAILESYNLAKIWNLPVLFVAEDNGYAESTASSWSVGGSQVGRGNGFGIPSREVDGQDFFE